MKKTVINRNGIAYFLMLLMVVLAACETIAEQILVTSLKSETDAPDFKSLISTW